MEIELDNTYSQKRITFIFVLVMEDSEIPLILIRSQIQFRKCLAIYSDSFVVLLSADSDCDSNIRRSISLKSHWNTISFTGDLQNIIYFDSINLGCHYIESGLLNGSIIDWHQIIQCLPFYIVGASGSDHRHCHFECLLLFSDMDLQIAREDVYFERKNRMDG